MPQFGAILLLAVIASFASNAVLSARDMVDVKTLNEYKEIFSREL